MVWPSRSCDIGPWGSLFCGCWRTNFHSPFQFNLQATSLLTKTLSRGTLVMPPYVKPQYYAAYSPAQPPDSMGARTTGLRLTHLHAGRSALQQHTVRPLKGGERGQPACTTGHPSAQPAPRYLPDNPVPAQCKELAQRSLSPFHRPPSSGQTQGGVPARSTPVTSPEPTPPPSRVHPTTPWRYTRDLVHLQAEIPKPWYFSATFLGTQTYLPSLFPIPPKGESWSR